MLISQNNNYQQPTFSSSSPAKRKAYDICRRVMNEFPIIYSETRLLKFQTNKKSKSFNKIIGFSSDLTENFRDYYDVENKNKYYTREILGLKKHKAGNCQEYSDTTYMALKINGYQDVKQLWLYAYNPKRNSLRDLDHVVTGIDFKIPSDYKYTEYDPIYMSPQYRIYPQNNSIVVDSWGGFVEYGKNLKNKYNSKDLLLGLLKNVQRTSLLKDDEELCFVPIKPKYSMPDDMISFFKNLFPKLLLSNKPSTPSPEILDVEIQGIGIKSSKIKKLKKDYQLTPNALK